MYMYNLLFFQVFVSRVACIYSESGSVGYYTRAFFFVIIVLLT